MRLAAKLFQKMKCASVVLMLSLLFVIGQFASFAEEQEESEGKNDVNFVLILDCSGSMSGDKGSDPNGLSYSAAKMFVDMLPSENANLSVIAMGANFGDEAYPVQGAEGTHGASGMPAEHYVKEAFTMQSIDEMEDKDAAKAAIDEIASLTGSEGYTPVGYSLEAAYDVLKKNEAQNGSAAIVLLTDGRVTGQDRQDGDAENDKYNEGKDFHSVDQYVASCRENDWSIYCLEMNFDGINNENSGNWTGNVGRHQMREVIPESSEFCATMNSADEAQIAFSEIFEKFFDVEPTTETKSFVDGNVEFQFNVGAMVAETTVTLSSIDPNFKRTDIDEICVWREGEEISKYTDSAIDEKHIVTYGDNYITMKLLVPKSGPWHISVNGKNIADNIQIGLYAISIREINLVCNTDDESVVAGVVAEDSIVSKGKTINFTAFYEYHGDHFPSIAFEDGIPRAYILDLDTNAVLQEMTPGESNYTAAITFNDSKTYHLAAVVESGNFRNGKKESDTFTFTVGNHPVRIEKEFETVTLNVNTPSDPINLGLYFRDDDENDVVTYNVYADSDAISTSVSDGTLTITPSKTAGDYTVTVSAYDQNCTIDDAVSQSMTVSVQNHELVMAEDTEISEALSFNTDSMPGFLKGMIGGENSDNFSIKWSDYFTDEDGTDENGWPALITFSADEENATEIVSVETTTEGASFKAVGNGKVVYTIHVADWADESISGDITVTVKSMSAAAMVWRKIQIPVILLIVILIIVIVLLIIAFVGRKIYGQWDVACGTIVKKGCVFARTAAGRRPKCDLAVMLRSLQIPCGLNGIKLVAGNKFGKKVFITGLENLDSLSIGASRYDNARLRKMKKVCVRPKENVTLVKGTVTLKMERKR